MHTGWKHGTRLYVNGRPGVIKSKRGTQWTFKHGGNTRTIKIRPTDIEWCYDVSRPVNRWPELLSVIVLKKNWSAFVYKRESYGGWHGAATARTIAVDVPVWQIAGTNRLLVGHLGEYRVYSKASFKPATRYEQDVWIGRGQPGKTFRSLKVVDPGPDREPPREPMPALYPVPSRDELSVGSYFNLN